MYDPNPSESKKARDESTRAVSDATEATERQKNAALRSAILSGNIDVVKKMVSAGCSVDQQVGDGNNLFELATDKAVIEFLIEKGAGGDINLDKFRGLDVKTIDFPARLDTPEDMLLSNETNILKPVRCWPCKHVFCAVFLKKWLDEPLSEDYPTTLKETCPKCRQDIFYIEIFSLASAAHWNECEKNIKAIAKQKETDIGRLKFSPEFCQFMKKARAANDRVNAAQKAMRLAQKEADEAKRKADESIDTERARIRSAADAREKQMRDNQIVDERVLNF